MDTLRNCIELIFSMALFINALLFIPQAVRIVKDKAARDVSLLTFSGFLIIQFAIVLHGIIVSDRILIWGYLFSMLTTGLVVILVLFYRRKNKAKIDLSLEEILNQLPGHIYWKDRNFTIVGCNTNNWKDFNLSSSNDILGKTDYDIFTKKVADNIRHNDKKVIETESSIIIEELSEDIEGKKSLYLSHKIPLRGRHGEILGILGVSLDVTDAKQEMLDQLEMLENIIAIMPAKVYWMNTDGVYLGCNDNEAHAIGLDSRRDIVGKRNVDLPGFLIPEALDPVNQKIMETGEPLTLEEPARLLDGTMGTFISSKVPIHNTRGDIIGLVGISIDITERKKTEQELIRAKDQAEAATQLKSEFISNMQHDIRTPISGIFSLLESAKHSKNLNEFATLLPYAAKAAKELLDLCNEVIDFESVEYGDKPVYSRKFSLIELVHSAVNLNSAASLVQHTSLELDIADNVPDIIRGDDYRLKKILINLLGNAVKFTERGQVKLAIELASKEQRKVTLRFHVTDTGIGIPRDQIDNIFEKFTRLNPSNAGKFKGTGLGLHIVKKFVAEIDGEMDVISEVGKGTEFIIDACFELPLVEQLATDQGQARATLTRHVLIQPAATELLAMSEAVEAPEEIALQEAVPVSTTPASSVQDAIQICLIEDDFLAMTAAAGVLSGLMRPCHIVKAFNVAEGLQALKQQRFDLVISDLGLPDGMGFDIVMAIKQDSGHINYQTPFVALTAHSDDAKRERAKTSGFLAMYNKPLLIQQADKLLADYVPDTQQSGPSEVVDFAVSTEIAAGKPQAAIDLLTMLVTSFGKERPLFTEAFAENNFTRARELFHKFRGGLSYVRAPVVEQLAKTLHEEVKILETQQGNLPDLMDKLQDLFNSVDEVADWLKTHKHMG